jgi:23S rRNA (guanosine2251-2'-O)-methyltransferase
MAKVGKKTRGPTPKAKDRTWHKNYRAPEKSRTRKSQTSKEQLIYGMNPVYEYLKSGTPAQKLIISSNLKPDAKLQEIVGFANQNGVAIYELPKPQLDTLTRSQSHQGVVLFSEDYQYSELSVLVKSGRTLVLLDHITDPHNLGAVIRSAAAFGADIVIPKVRQVGVNATVWKTSAGNAMKTKVAQVANLNTCIEKLKQAGYFVVGLDGEAELNVSSNAVKDNAKIAFVAGNEGSGIAALTKKNCDVLAKISTAVESLNVAQAVSIALYEIKR